MKIRYAHPLLGGVLAALLWSCVSAGPATEPEGAPSATASATSAPAATATPTVPPEPTPTLAPLDRPLYRISAAIDTRLQADGTMTLTVDEQAFYTNRSAESIPELVLQFEPSRDQPLFELTGFSSDRTSQPSAAAVDNGQLRVTLDAPLAPGESASLRVQYRRKVAQENTLIGWNDYQIVLGNWYAFFPPYLDGKGWLAHSPGNVGEHLTFPYADFDIRFDVLGDSVYWIAASGTEEEGELPHHFRFTGRSFALALTTQMPFRQTVGGVEIIGYTREQYEEQGIFMTGVAAKAVQIYSEHYGEYPHPRLTVLESELPDGMEFDGLVFLNPDLFPYYKGGGVDYLTLITAHETSHQWWYGRVGNDQAIEPWLDEPFAVYSELLFYEHAYPSLVQWWWSNRVDRYPSYLCVDMPIYQFTGFRGYVDAVYLRGVKMLYALRKRMGNQAFEDSLRDLQSTYFGSVITPADVFRTFQAHSAVSLNPVWNEYLCMPPAPG
jgi:hypothetical protein